MKFIISAHAYYFRLFSKYTNCIIYKYKTYVIQDFVINICYATRCNRAVAGVLIFVMATRYNRAVAGILLLIFIMATRYNRAVAGLLIFVMPHDTIVR